MKRHSRALAVAATVAWAGVLGAPPSAGAAPPSLGSNDIAMRVHGASDQRLEQVAAAAEGLGSSAGVPAQVLRMELGWSDVQPGSEPNPPFSWQQYDRIYNTLREHGIKPLWIVTRAPNWARNPADRCRPAPEGQCPPADNRLGDWQNFVRNAVLRYPESAGVEVWNEPNLKRFWGTAIDPGRYVRVLRAAYLGVQQAVEERRPSMPAGWTIPVLLGAPADMESGGMWGGVSASDWLDAVYEAEGSGRDFDALSAHIYPTQTVSPDRATPTLLDTLRRYVAIRDAHADSAKPIWLTEIGYHTAGYDHNFGQHTDPRHQGEFLRCAYGLLVDHPSNVAAFLINHLIDQSQRPTDPEGSFGLLANDLGFKAPPPNDGYSTLQSYFAGSPTRVAGCE